VKLSVTINIHNILQFSVIHLFGIKARFVLHNLNTDYPWRFKVNIPWSIVSPNPPTERAGISLQDPQPIVGILIQPDTFGTR